MHRALEWLPISLKLTLTCSKPHRNTYDCKLLSVGISLISYYILSNDCKIRSSSHSLSTTYSSFYYLQAPFLLPSNMPLYHQFSTKLSDLLSPFRKDCRSLSILELPIPTSLPANSPFDTLQSRVCAMHSTQTAPIKKSRNLFAKSKSLYLVLIFLDQFPSFLSII